MCGKRRRMSCLSVVPTLRKCFLSEKYPEKPAATVTQPQPLADPYKLEQICQQKSDWKLDAHIADPGIMLNTTAMYKRCITYWFQVLIRTNLIDPAVSCWCLPGIADCYCTGAGAGASAAFMT